MNKRSFENLCKLPYLSINKNGLLRGLDTDMVIPGLIPDDTSLMRIVVELFERKVAVVV
jgi:hypothetical protein